MLVLSSADVLRLLPLDDCIAAVEEAFRDHGQPGLLSAHVGRGAFHIKTAIAGRRFGAKANANFPSNPQERGLPAIQGVMLLFDADDGRPLAVLDSIEITALRTAAATAVAAKYLAPKGATTATIVGCGKQGRVQLEAVRRVLPLRRVFAFDIEHERARYFAREMDATPVTTLEARDTDVWITCTPSRVPFLRREHVRDGALVAAVGADNPSKSEITPELMAVSRVITDVTAQCLEMGDLHHALAVGATAVAELGDVIRGRCPARQNERDIVIFDSTGAGFQDTAAASLVYDRAQAG
ncbi:MAG TPA: ornithine cyclodeaminase family protein [Thermoanaerobaculia bacterium]|nr:ornithine cyclodeaminase family protein [Thermoanaerobaculia bacterium]